MKPELLTSIFVRAAEEPIGLVIETNNAKVLLNKLYEHRKIVDQWYDLMIVQPSNPNEIFIVQKSMELDP